ncbi:MAG: HEPN domain-containing protein [Pyrobaculum sp.]
MGNSPPNYEILKRRPFLRDARWDFEKGDYDLVLFHVEQSLQLYAKYLLYKKGDFPKTHSLVRLLKDLAKVYNSKDLERFIEENLEAIYLLEEAYMSTPRGADIASRILELGDKLLKVFKCLESLCLELEYLREICLGDVETCLKKVKEICRERDPGCRVIVFGSYVRSAMRIDSDIDVLLITDLAQDTLARGQLRAQIAKEVGPAAPLEIHIVTNKEYETWYKKFIDKHMEI